MVTPKVITSLRDLAKLFYYSVEIWKVFFPDARKKHLELSSKVI